MSNKTKTNLLIDSLIFLGFLVANEPALTGVPIHEWFATAFIAALVTHLVLHWEWIAHITATFVKKLFHESRLNYVLDALLFTSFVTVNLSGLLISRSILATFGIQLNVTPAWRSIHSLSADATMLLIALHFALHWKWIVNTIGRYVVTPLRSLFRRPSVRSAAQLAVQPVEIDLNK
jgi:hypothetical protein